MPPPPTKKGSSTPQEELLQQNINDLARVISSEARGVNSTEQAMVGWTIVNRMKKRSATRVSAVWNGYSHSHSPDYSSIQIATGILTGKAVDISQGATHFYSPGTMPKEGEATVGFDVRGGLEEVPGITRNGRPVKSYRPLWALSEDEIKVPGTNSFDFRFFRER